MVQVAETVLPLNELLARLHGPTDCIGSTMRQLVDFPDVATPEYTDILDLRLAVDVDPLTNGATAKVSAMVRYSTSMRRQQVVEFYTEALGGSSVLALNPASVDQPAVSALLRDTASTRVGIAIDDFPGYRSVKVMVDYEGFDHHELFDRFAGWHNGTAPVTSYCPPTGVEINTFASGRGPSTLVLYSTSFSCPETSEDDRRAMVDTEIERRGWTYREPREGIMFIQDGEFEAETHIEGDSEGSTVTFVGEFQLR